MSLLGRKPPSRFDVDPFGYWSKPKRSLTPGLDMPRGGYDPGPMAPFPGPRTPRQLRSSVRKVSGRSAWRHTNARDQLNRGAIRKAIEEGDIEARFWHKYDDMENFRRDTNNPWLPARIGSADVSGFMTFEPYWFKDRGIRAYKGDDGTLRFAVTHNHILQLRDRG